MGGVMKLIKKDVLILVEHKVRELESACLLKYAFERRGYSVEVVSLFPCKESYIFPLGLYKSVHEIYQMFFEIFSECKIGELTSRTV